MKIQTQDIDNFVINTLSNIFGGHTWYYGPLTTNNEIGIVIYS